MKRAILRRAVMRPVGEGLLRRAGLWRARRFGAGAGELRAGAAGRAVCLRESSYPSRDGWGSADVFPASMKLLADLSVPGRIGFSRGSVQARRNGGPIYPSRDGWKFWDVCFSVDARSTRQK